MRYLILALMLSACGTPSADNVSAVSRNEAEALNDAAEMLEGNVVVPGVENGANER